MKQTSLFWTILLIGLFGAKNLFASPLSFQNSPYFSTENMEKTMDWYTLDTHPMGSRNQTKIAQTLEQTLNKLGWKTINQKFKAVTPNINATEFGGENKNEKTTKKVLGQNIIATLKGNDNCSLIIGGHYDTKYFKNFHFVGANDGGSSTIFMIELARVLKNLKFNKGSLGACSITLVFFDGEEAFLPQWDEGRFALGIEDHLYGSHEFVNKSIVKKEQNYLFEKKPICLTIILDMIGHKKQNLFITNGSKESYANKLVASSKNVKIKSTSIMIDDDHIPFKNLEIPFLHIIDWTNLNEWHTVNDTKEIISYKLLADFGKIFLEFLSTQRIKDGK